MEEAVTMANREQAPTPEEILESVRRDIRAVETEKRASAEAPSASIVSQLRQLGAACKTASTRGVSYADLHAFLGSVR